MKIHILFTCDAHKSHASRSLRGVFTNLEDLEDAKYTLRKNNVVDWDIESGNDDEYFDVVSIEENEYETDGGYY